MGIDFSTPGDDQDDEQADEAPSFSDPLSESQLRDAIREYSEWCVDHYDVLNDVDLDEVRIEISHKMKRAAGKAGARQTSEGLKDLRIRFAWKAYDKWGWTDEWVKTIRHELIHILQYQTKGDGDHGAGFKRKANKIDAPRHCPQFAEYKFEIFCKECGQFVAGRYKRSKLVKKPEKYTSGCCSAPLRVEQSTDPSRYDQAKDALSNDG